MAFSPDGRTLAWAGLDGELRVWTVATGEVSLEVKTNAVNTLCFSPDGHQLAVGSYGYIDFFDPSTGRRSARVGAAAGFPQSTGVIEQAFFPGGERVAAAKALERIRQRLEETKQGDPPVEYKFSLADVWSRRLFVALLRRYGIRPYRYHRQRHTTVMAKVPKRFVDDTLWPEFQELNDTLRAYLDEVTSRVVSEGVHADSSEAEVVPDAQKSLPGL